MIKSLNNLRNKLFKT